MTKPLALYIYYFLTLLILFVYSFTQVDLNLTLINNSAYLVIQNVLTQIGYFNRPLSTYIYLFVFISLFATYLGFLKLSLSGYIKYNEIKKIIIATAVILFFAYPAFSYDIFNYMFDAKIFTQYGQNPYLHKALDFPFDPWIRFMRWTHRVYPYGPLWLVTTIPVSFLGFGKFISTLYLFKAFFVGIYFSSCYLIAKILEKINRKDISTGLVFFALNPLIVIENLVSPHNDSLTLFLVLVSIYFLTINRFGKSFVFMLLSGLVKYTSLILLPVYAYIIAVKNLKINRDLILFYLLYFAMIAILSLDREFLPWYIIPLVGLAALVYKPLFIRFITILASFSALLKYISFLYRGEWFIKDYYNFIILVVIIMFLGSTLYFLRFKSIIK